MCARAGRTGQGSGASGTPCRTTPATAACSKRPLPPDVNKPILLLLPKTFCETGAAASKRSPARQTMLLLLVLLLISFSSASTAAPPLPFPLYQAHASSHYSLGALIGRAAAPRIADWTRSYAPLSTTLRPYVRTKAGAAAFQRLRNASCAAFPYICEEVDGLASGSGQSPTTMMAQVTGITKPLASFTEMADSGNIVGTHKTGGIVKSLGPDAERKVRDLLEGGRGPEIVLER